MFKPLMQTVHPGMYKNVDVIKSWLFAEWIICLKGCAISKFPIRETFSRRLLPRWIYIHAYNCTYRRACGNVVYSNVSPQWQVGRSETPTYCQSKKQPKNCREILLPDCKILYRYFLQTRNKAKVRLSGSLLFQPLVSWKLNQ